MPVSAGNHGAVFYDQAFGVDLAANGLGVVVSDVMMRQLVAPFAAPDVGRVQTIGTSGPIGSVFVGTGTVTRFVR